MLRSRNETEALPSTMAHSASGAFPEQASGPQEQVCMGLLLGAAIWLGLWAGPAAAQNGNTGVFWQCVPPSAASPNGSYCPVNATYRLPVDSGTSGAAVAGTQAGLTISSATALTVPAGATKALIQAQGTNTAGGVCLFWRDDGTDPTGTAGQALAANTTLVYSVSGLPIKLIAATGATCTATISYYK